MNLINSVSAILAEFEFAREFYKKGLKVENFENWNKKVRKKNLDDSLNLKENENLSQRDYDKDPIIIKDYHQIFNSVLSLFSALVAFNDFT